MLLVTIAVSSFSESVVLSSHTDRKLFMAKGGLMDSSLSDTILVGSVSGTATTSERTERGIVSRSVANAIPVETLKNNVQRFFEQLNEILAPGEDTIGDFRVSEVRVAAEITGDGQVSLMGSGVKVGMHGGFTLILTRTTD
jgi:hypothetical protein